MQAIEPIVKHFLISDFSKYSFKNPAANKSPAPVRV
jgi:hypothetical protein